MSMLRPVAVVTDIEGTVIPIAYVYDVLFPYARARLETCVARDDAEIREILGEIERAVPGQAPLLTLQHWMDRDAKIPALKSLQGIIWRQGFADGALVTPMYPDVAPWLRRWAGAGVRQFVFSAGSAEAQRLLFAHSSDGDLSPVFSGYFDTRAGGKRDIDSYGRLAIGMNVPTLEVVFLSDAEDELDAAAAAGMRTCQLVREADGTVASDRHPVAADFGAVARLMDLPGGSG
jgi:enolase-phosphatase E1